MQPASFLAQSLWLRAEAAGAAWLAAERGRFVLFLPVCMAAGIVAYFSWRTEPPLWPGATIALAAAMAGAVLRGWMGTRAICLAAAFAAVGFASASLATRRAQPWDALPRTAVIVQGTVDRVETLPEGRRVTLASAALDDGAALHRMVRVRLRGNDPVVLAPGDTAQIRALLRTPPPPAYPGGWDTQRDAFFDGIGAYGFALGAARRVTAASGSAWQAVREAIAGRVMAGLPGERGAIAATLLTGLGTAIPPADRAAFAASGLAHLLAVAGLHIGIVMGLVFLLARTVMAAVEHAALFWPARRIASLAALAAGGFYMALTGAHVPILRSFAMASLVTLAVLTGRRAISLRALALAAMAIMLVAPDDVMGVSFQMSFAAVLALVAGWEALRPWLRGFALGRWWRTPLLHAGGLAATSALAGTASLPFAAYHFGNATLWYVPANMLAVPITAFWVLPWGLAALLLMPAGCEHLALAPMGWGIGVILALARGVAAWPGAAMPVPRMPQAALLLFTIGLVWLCAWRTRVRLAGIAPILAGLVLPFTVALPDAFMAPDGRVAAARVGGTVFVETRGGASLFEQQSPARIWGGAPERAFPATGGPGCDTTGCRWREGNTNFLLARAPDTPCRGADVALAIVVLRGCDASVVVDRRTTEDYGASLLAGAAVTTDSEERGDRPWVVHAHPYLPPARTE